VKNISRVDSVIWRRVGDEIVVITDDAVATHVLNKTAAFIWELCDGTIGIDDITARLTERFDVSEEEAKVDIEEIIEKLTGLGIMKQDEEAAGS
jgi:hypothetical protein